MPFSSNEFSFTNINLINLLKLLKMMNINKNERNEKETFKFIQKDFQKKLPGQPLTYRLIMNFTQILKKNIDFLKDYFSIETFKIKMKQL
ncbi:hypothetical protein M0811_07257 [Anaeramoeba ignava]|uniref:Uncharacterized protein n=1 Tax=Anaeramoeba ignava TaxID=1746090 RepID=A0A9Q0LLV4_ANAIG|nr:hypothetical protein M0811_07257 [Anaeramoeba ignava]